ncbi:Glc operon transcriptional activator [Methylacidimicrobium cyclopophantes]|uniref:Glc operon transcriptional activator n=2 Tax=Methylacidimicrobium cyclopophantes TaxID=1041766 RepID=A0A5E6MD47_9BACT|nr:Glc operon transcriptional activator [Methylacidimicrobium cyclopophantes]
MPKRVAVEIERSLRERLASGEWASTGRLPTERRLAAHYGVARNTLRKAIEGLVREGKIFRHVGRGIFVNREPSPIEQIFHVLRDVSPADLLAVRQIVEPQAAALAASHASRAQIEAIAEAHRMGCESGEIALFEQWDAEFHQRIFAATRNELLFAIHRLLSLIRQQNAWIDLKRESFGEEQRRNYCRSHARILEALRRRDDVAAEREMRLHLEETRQALFGRH